MSPGEERNGGCGDRVRPHEEGRHGVTLKVPPPNGLRFSFGPRQRSFATSTFAMATTPGLTSSIEPLTLACRVSSRAPTFTYSSA